MITIVVTHEDDQSDEFDFDPSQAAITIGRRSTNDVCIPNLSVSGRHARIVFNGGEAWVEDLNSTNGTYINNRLISRQMLNHQDELVIGKTRVRYENTATSTTLDAHTHQQDQAYGQNIEDAPDQIPTPMPTESTAGGRQNNDFDALDHQDESMSSEHIDETNFEAVDDGLDRRAEPLGIAPKKPHVTPAQIAAASAAAIPAAGIGLNSLTGQSSNPESSEDIFESLADDLAPTGSRQPGNDIQDDGQDDDDLDDNGMPMTLSQKAKRALGSDRRSIAPNGEAQRATHNRDITDEPADIATAAPKVAPKKAVSPTEKPVGAVIEIRNGAKSGQTLPIDKPVTTLGRPGIQIAAIMRKPDGYFLMHIESDDSVDRPTLNNDAIGDEPMLLQSGDELNVAGIDVKFNLA